MFIFGQKIKAKILKLSYKGKGIAKLNGIVVFVANSCPGDFCQLEITKVKKNYCEAKILQILQPGPSRRKAPCPVSGICGGCQWQHIHYTEQLQQKTQIFNEICQKNAFPLPNEPILHFDEFRYRNRIQIHKKGQQIGFKQKASNKIISISECLISQKNIEKCFDTIKTKKDGRWEIYETRDFGTQIRKNKNSEFGFRQVNTKMNRKLIDLVNKYIKPKSGSNILDLYGGAGNLSLEIANMYPESKVHVVDLNRFGIGYGIDKKTKFKLDNIFFHQSCVNDFLEEKKVSNVESIIVDPPREGCGNEALEKINQLGASFVVYISCDPMTWARDAKKLLDSGKYKLKYLVALDMFPQTYHFEVFSFFKHL